MTERIIGYARVSTVIQTNDSQIERLSQFAQDNGLAMEKVFSVTGPSAVSNNSIDEALEYLQLTGIEKMVVYNRSRISRSKEETESIESRFLALGKKIIYIEE